MTDINTVCHQRLPNCVHVYGDAYTFRTILALDNTTWTGSGDVRCKPDCMLVATSIQSGLLDYPSVVPSCRHSEQDRLRPRPRHTFRTILALGNTANMATAVSISAKTWRGEGRREDRHTAPNTAALRDIELDTLQSKGGE